MNAQMTPGLRQWRLPSRDGWIKQQASARRRPHICCRVSRQQVDSSSARLTSETMSGKVVVVGAGIAGLATALALHKVAVPVHVLEAGAVQRAEGSALGIWSNGWRALDALGVADELRRQTLPLDRVELCRNNGRILKAFSFEECDAGATGLEFRGVRRAALQQALLDALPPGTVSYSSAVAQIFDTEDAAGGVTPTSGAMQNGSTQVSPTAAAPVRLRLRDKQQDLECAAVVGADGAKSVVAKHLGLADPKPARYIAFRGVAAASPSDLGLPSNTIRQIWGEGVRAGMYPISQKEVYWFVTTNSDAGSRPPPPGPPSASAMRADIMSAIKGWSWQVDAALTATTDDDLSTSRIVDRWTRGSVGKGRITLCGDSLHPMTPNLGQGACAALEDAVELARAVAAALAASSSTSSSTSTSASTNIGPGQGRLWTPAMAVSVAAAMRQFEQGREKRCLLLAVRANLMGQALQIANPLVCTVRDLVISTVFNPAHFLDHTSHDCGSLPAPALQLTSVR